MVYPRGTAEIWECYHLINAICVTAILSSTAQLSLSYLLTALNVLKRSDLAAFPCIASATMVLARDFELPGLPTRNSGIRFSMHTTIMKMFSFKAWFLAIFGPSSISSSITLRQLRTESVQVTYLCQRGEVIPMKSHLNMEA